MPSKKRNITINIAKIEDKQPIIDFFNEHLKKNNDWIYSEEFLCPYWISWAITRKQIITTKENDTIIWALRFYQQKRHSIISLYQFAIAEKSRWKNLLKEMLKYINSPIIQSRCKKKSEFNKYYKKTGRTLEKTDHLWNLRQLWL